MIKIKETLQSGLLAFCWVGVAMWWFCACAYHALVCPSHWRLSNRHTHTQYFRVFITIRIL